MKTYNVNLLSQVDIDRFNNIIINIADLFHKEDFKQFILEKCKITLENIVSLNLPIEEEPNDIETDYRAGMKVEIGDDYIMLYNDSEIDIASKNMKETTKAKYPAQLSLAEIVEYGIGYTGDKSPYKSQVEDWQYDVNNHGAKGWYFYDDAGNLCWSNGFEGKFIFYKLSEAVKTFMSDWINEYIEKNL